jgi:hypothetical protein
LHLARAPFEVFALDCPGVGLSVRAAPMAGRGPCRAGETRNR